MKLSYYMEKYSRYIQYVGMILIMGYFFWQIRDVIFGVQEEYGLFYIVQKGDYFAWLDSVSKQTGRITFYVLGWFWAGPMLCPNPIVYKIVMYVLIAMDIFCFYYLLKRHVDERFAVFSVSFIIMMLQISHQHNLLITYNYLHIPFILLMISTHLLLNYCKGKSGYRAVIASACCNFAASFFQETFVLFYIVCFVVIMYYENTKGFLKRAVRSLWLLKYHVLGGAVFLIVYFLFRLSCNMGTYAGNSLCLTQPLMSVQVLAEFLTGMLPGRSFFELIKTVGAGCVLDFIGKKDIVFIILEILFLCILMKRLKPFKKSGYLYALLVLSAVLSCLLHSVSLQYITWVSNGNAYAYVPSYYASFFLDTIVCLWICSAYISASKYLKKLVLCIFAVITASLSIMTVSTNKYYNQEYNVEFDHYDTYLDFFKRSNLETWEDNAQVLLIDSYPVDTTLIHQAMTTVYYDAYFFNVTTDENNLDQSRKCYVLTYSKSEIELDIRYSFDGM